MVDWAELSAIALVKLHFMMRLLATWSWLLVLIAAINWTFGGWPVLRRKVVIRQSWPFVAMRWIGMLVWLGTLCFVIRTAPGQTNIILAAAHGAAAIVMLVGTVRKPFRERFIETPRSGKSNFSDSQ